MIRLVVATIVLTVLIDSVAFAQNSTPKVQVFGGYSYVHLDNGGLTGGDLGFALRELKLHSERRSTSLVGTRGGSTISTVGSESRGTLADAMACTSRVTETTTSKATGHTVLVGPVLS